MSCFVPLDDELVQLSQEMFRSRKSTIRRRYEVYMLKVEVKAFERKVRRACVTASVQRPLYPESQ